MSGTIPHPHHDILDSSRLAGNAAILILMFYLLAFSGFDYFIMFHFFPV